MEFQGQEDELAWLGTLTSVEDIHKTLKESQDKAQREGKSTIRLWFEKLSSVVMYYSGALDTLAQQHPEYLSLVWGMLKFILMVSLLSRQAFHGLIIPMSKGNFKPR